MNVVNVITAGGGPHPCDLHIPFKRKDYVIRSLANRLNRSDKSDTSFMCWKIVRNSMCASRFGFIYFHDDLKLIFRAVKP